MKCYNLSGKTSLQSVCQAIIIAVDQGKVQAKKLFELL